MKRLEVDGQAVVTRSDDANERVKINIAKTKILHKNHQTITFDRCLRYSNNYCLSSALKFIGNKFYASPFDEKVPIVHS